MHATFGQWQTLHRRVDERWRAPVWDEGALYEATLRVAAPSDGGAIDLPDTGASDKDRYDGARRTLKAVVEQLDALAAGVLGVLSPPDAASVA